MAHPSKPPIGGIFFALGGGITLSVNDLAIKALSGTYALHQVILLRALIGMAIVLAVIWASRSGFGQLLTRRPKDHLLRVSIVMVSNVTYFVGLSLMPLADAVATAFVAPMLVTLMSALILGEHVGPRRWAAVAVGVGGLMMSQAYRTSEAALVAPFEYIGMPMAILWGVLVFGTWPDATAWVGIALICGAGLYTLWRETMRRKDVDVAAPSGDL